MRRVWLFCVAALGLAAAARAQEAAPPVFFAISVADLDVSIEWYRRMFAVAATRLPSWRPRRCRTWTAPR